VTWDPRIILDSDHRPHSSLTSDPMVIPGLDSSPAHVSDTGSQLVACSQQAKAVSEPTVSTGEPELQGQESLGAAGGSSYTCLFFTHPSSLASNTWALPTCLGLPRPGSRGGRNWPDQPTPLFAQVWVKIASSMHDFSIPPCPGFCPSPSFASCSCP
jgi:hypothetical protein